MMLQVNSQTAEQKITVQCKNAEVTPTFNGYRSGHLFVPEGDDSSSRSGLVELKTLYNGCMVTKDLYSQIER